MAWWFVLFHPRHKTAVLGCHILWTTKICILEGIWFVCEEQVLDDNLKSITLGAIWNFSKVTGLSWIDMGHKGPVTATVHWHCKGSNPVTNQSINQPTEKFIQKLLSEQCLKLWSNMLNWNLIKIYSYFGFQVFSSRGTTMFHGTQFEKLRLNTFLWKTAVQNDVRSVRNRRTDRYDKAKGIISR
jgi:hypothetical protein